MNVKTGLLDELLEEHLTFESEQVHVLTALYGVGCGNDASMLHLRVAKSLELMKASTLILDDFLDKADTRNGLPSIYAKRGAEHAVLIGEILHSTSLIELCAAVQESRKDVLANALSLFEQTYRTINLGQIEDTNLERRPFERKSPGEEEYFQMIRHTSAIFIQLPLLLGGLLSQRPPSILSALGQYGIKIGLAYQVRDDVLDVMASSKLTGKPIAGDIRNRKKRLPVLRLRDLCDDKDWALLSTEFNRERDLTDYEVDSILKLIQKYRAAETCMETVQQLCSEGIAALDGHLKDEEVSQLTVIAGLLTDFSCLKESRIEEE